MIHLSLRPSGRSLEYFKSLRPVVPDWPILRMPRKMNPLAMKTLDCLLQRRPVVLLEHGLSDVDDTAWTEQHSGEQGQNHEPESGQRGTGFVVAEQHKAVPSLTERFDDTKSSAPQSLRWRPTAHRKTREGISSHQIRLRLDPRRARSGQLPRVHQHRLNPPQPALR